MSDVKNTDQDGRTVGDFLAMVEEHSQPASHFEFASKLLAGSRAACVPNSATLEAVDAARQAAMAAVIESDDPRIQALEAVGLGMAIRIGFDAGALVLAEILELFAMSAAIPEDLSAVIRELAQILRGES